VGVGGRVCEEIGSLVAVVQEEMRGRGLQFGRVTEDIGLTMAGKHRGGFSRRLGPWST
jgi:hypothetical protein